MESFEQFKDRIYSFEKKRMDLGDDGFTVNPSLAKKVNDDNTFRAFYGDTVVFELDNAVKRKLAECTDKLYSAAGECFCQRLVPSTFHVTLHDLSNSASLSAVAEEMFGNELKIVEKAKTLRKSEGAKIKLKSTAVFNMVNTSLVLGLCPVDADDYNRLMELYSVIDGVKKLSYPLTPHITLAYYNVGGFDARAVSALTEAVNDINTELDFTVSVGELYYQKFISMNDYINIIKLL